VTGVAAQIGHIGIAGPGGFGHGGTISGPHVDDPVRSLPAEPTHRHDHRRRRRPPTLLRGQRQA
jgi:hypothetical protein